MNRSLADIRALVLRCIALMALLALAGCSNTGPDEGEREFPYPLDVGNRWEYQRAVWYSDPMFPGEAGVAVPAGSLRSRLDRRAREGGRNE